MKDTSFNKAIVVLFVAVLFVACTSVQITKLCDTITPALEVILATIDDYDELATKALNTLHDLGLVLDVDDIHDLVLDVIKDKVSPEFYDWLTRFIRAYEIAQARACQHIPQFNTFCTSSDRVAIELPSYCEELDVRRMIDFKVELDRLLLVGVEK